MRFLSLLLLIACGGADPDTLIPDLRVMAIRQQPAEANPFTPITVEVWVANPEQQSVDLMVWPCTSFGDDCLEAEYFSEQNEPWAQAVSVEGSGTALYATTTLSIPPLLGGLLQEIPEEEQPFRGGQLAVLACYSGLCPIINRVKAGIQPTEDLKNPADLMSNLPIFGASLAKRSLTLSNRDPALAIQHPELRPTFDLPIETSLETEVALPFEVTLNSDANEDSLIYGYATAGAFGMNDRVNNLLRSSESIAELNWVSPDQSGDAQLYVIIENGVGGIDVWVDKAVYSD